jgi:hypothetical protein
MGWYFGVMGDYLLDIELASWVQGSAIGAIIKIN